MPYIYYLIGTMAFTEIDYAKLRKHEKAARAIGIDLSYRPTNWTVAANAFM